MNKELVSLRVPHLPQSLRIGHSERKTHGMMFQPVKTAAVLLLTFVLAWYGAFTHSAGVNANSRRAKASCCCRGCDSTGCVTPACCPKSSQPSPPSAPVLPSV